MRKRQAVALVALALTVEVVAGVLFVGDVIQAPLAQAVTQPQYIINCAYTGQTQAVDPIVSPGVSSAHLHDFIGQPNITSTTAPADLLANRTATNCKNQNGFTKPDGSAVWAPTLYNRGVVVHPTHVNIYYRCTPFCGQVAPLPASTGYVAGDSHAIGDQLITHVKWDCGANNSGTTPYTTYPPDCTQYMPGSGGLDGLTVVIMFPMCWSGSLPAGDDTAQFAYPSGSTCPLGFPTKVERPELHIHYGIWTLAAKTDVTLSSGPYYTLHGDYLDAWDEVPHASIVKTCLNSGSTCT